jgi:hypothetical protein
MQFIIIISIIIIITINFIFLNVTQHGLCNDESNISFFKLTFPQTITTFKQILIFQVQKRSSQGCELVQSGIWFPVLRNYVLPWFAQLQYIVPAHILQAQKYTLQASEGDEGRKSSQTAIAVDLSITALSAVCLVTVNTLKNCGRYTHHLRYLLT